MLISVAVPVPFLDALTYNCPSSLPVPAVGARVRVPLGSRTVTGCVVSHVSPEEGVEAKDIVSVVDQAPLLPAGIVALCRWVADYYMAGVGDAIAVAMPPGAARKASSFKTQRIVSATVHGLEHGPSLGKKQIAALEELAAAPMGLPATTLRERGIGSDVVARLVSKGLATIRHENDDRDPFERAAAMDTIAPDPSRALTAEQASALARLEAMAGERVFQVAVLHGVTGSGKTELYRRLAERVCQSGRQALIMVPEIALTPSVAAQFRGAFGTRVAIQHSGLGDGERHDQWQRIRRGDIDAVIGTRSAVFAPLDRLGLIVVDEEHDNSYKQEESPRYHGRDVAVMRASREGALVVLGSATPSMESFQNATVPVGVGLAPAPVAAARPKYERIVLERRVLDRPLASVRIVNMRDEMKEQGPEVVISRDLAGAIGDRLTRGEQALVLLNRRGYSTAVFCRQCGDAFECPNCSVSLTVHTARNGWKARCHYCNHSEIVPKQCRKCAAPYLEHAGFGTEKVEQQIRALYPEARVGRLDRDSVRRRGALSSLLMKVARRELDVLVGTQMIAKGHDFPGVTLVGVISADVGLGIADFRASERTFQLLTQVAGRAGRGERAGEAIIQTLYPEHYSIQLACRQDFTAFFDKEIVYRRSMQYPPFVAMINVVVRGRTFDAAMREAQEVVRRMAPAAAAVNFKILGPAPAPLVKLRGEHRVQFFLKGTRRAPMRDALKTVLSGMPEIRKRVTVDVDPMNML